jgi:hypothetical protein
MKTTIWTPTVRRSLYELLVLRFGPHAKWELPKTPGNGRREEFDAFCASFANAVGAKSGLAVLQQIAFAVQAMPAPKHRGMILIAILNKAAAAEMGFIAL